MAVKKYSKKFYDGIRHKQIFSHYLIGNTLFALNSVPYDQVHRSLRLAKRLAGYQDYPVSRGVNLRRGKIFDRHDVSCFYIWSIADNTWASF